MTLESLAEAMGQLAMIGNKEAIFFTVGHFNQGKQLAILFKSAVHDSYLYQASLF